jgi:hypothetical protein
MSGSKFAAITSHLLARKGEAKPWHEPLRETLARQRQAPDTEPPNPALEKPPPRAKTGTPVKRCSVRMTPQDYERLGIIAVKKSSNRQLLLQQAVLEFLARTAQEYPADCACLAAGSMSDFS